VLFVLVGQAGAKLLQILIAAACTYCHKSRTFLSHGGVKAVPLFAGHAGHVTTILTRQTSDSLNIGPALLICNNLMPWLLADMQISRF